MRDPNMAAATLIGAQSDAMRAAAENQGGAMMGFMGLGMAQQAGGANAQNLFAMGRQNTQAYGQAEEQAQTGASEGQEWRAPAARAIPENSVPNAELKNPPAAGNVPAAR